MSLLVTSLNSGSNGNCYYIGNEQEAILIDAGLTCRETEKRMKRLDLSMKKVKAIFVSHEHSDHIRGVPVLARRYQLPVYITRPTLLNGGMDLDAHLAVDFRPHEVISVGSLRVLGFPKVHDAADPHSFIIRCGEICIGVFTDLGVPCEQLIHHFRQCHAAFLETNYDKEMLENGRYPWHLKKRISGGMGHLSNLQALEVFRAHRPSFMSHLFLSHLSKDNNRPELVQELFEQHADGVKIIVASRYEETRLYTILANAGRIPAAAAATGPVRSLASTAWIPTPGVASGVAPEANPHPSGVRKKSAALPQSDQTMQISLF